MEFIDQLPVGFLAQLVERCTGIAEVMGSIPVRAWIFFISSLHRSANIWIFIYLKSSYLNNFLLKFGLAFAINF